SKVLDSWAKKWRILAFSLWLRANGKQFPVSLRKPLSPLDDRSIAAYARERFGEELLNDLFRPFVAALVHDVAESVSAACGLTYLRCALARTLVPESGMAGLVNAIARCLPAVFLGHTVTRVVLDGRAVAGVEVRTTDGDKFS